MADSDESMYCIVTGASSGIGKAIAQGIMQRVKGSYVVLASRGMDKCEKAKRELEDGNPSSSCSCHALDLAQFESVRTFADSIKADLTKRKTHLSLLVNNAGIWTTAKDDSGDDETFRTNHLGPHLLTQLLLPHMKNGSRIVNVSSRAHYAGSMSFNRDGSLVEVHRTWANWASFGFVSYAQSKLCNVLFTAELNRRLKGKGIIAVASSPGPVNTSLFHNLPYPLQTLIKPLAHRLFRSPEEGAASSLYAALSPDLSQPMDTCTIFVHDDKICEPSEMSKDSDLANKLWIYSDKLTGGPSDDDP